VSAHEDNLFWEQKPGRSFPESYAEQVDHTFPHQATTKGSESISQLLTDHSLHVLPSHSRRDKQLSLGYLVTQSSLYCPDERATWGAATEKPNEQDTAERRLKDGFSALVERLDLPALIQLTPDRVKLPRNIGDYSLAPVVSSNPKNHSSESPATSVDMPDNVTPHYGFEGKRPYLDAGLAIGLIYRDTLAAVASACTTNIGNIRIVQLQGVYRTESRAKNYKSGLHGGFLWRETLVRAWIEVGSQLGTPALEIQGSRNNRWIALAKSERLWQGYDRVAKGMGFKPVARGNWGLDLEQARPQPTTDSMDIAA
jgi:hypothetical protein